MFAKLEVKADAINVIVFYTLQSAFEMRVEIIKLDLCPVKIVEQFRLR